MRTYRIVACVLISAPLLACAGNTPAVAETSSATNADATAEGTGPGPETGDPGTGTATTGQVGTTTASPESSGDDDGGNPFKFDVHGVNEVGECEESEAGVYCREGRAVECDGLGNTVSSTLCTPNICLSGTGCVECLDGQYHCQGPRVMTCDANANPPHWNEIETCDPAGGYGCDQEQGACVALQPIGELVPTGQYFQYADFHIGASAFTGGYDVDSFGDFIYVSSFNFGQGVDVYQVEGIDSDEDGEFEPNQHPDNPDDTGPIEERTIVFVESIPNVLTYGSTTEILALEDRMFVGGTSITEYIFGGASSPLTTAPAWLSTFAQVGYDDINGVWYASNEGDLRVFQYDADTQAWGIAFRFPALAGDHMDGLEVVTDPNTGTPYVYVSDMTSDYIGQYRLDAELGWVQENMFQYAGTAGSLVEGMGFGAFNHFWATGGDSLYEVGGGDLTTYIEPAPTG